MSSITSSAPSRRQRLRIAWLHTRVRHTICENVRPSVWHQTAVLVARLALLGVMCCANIRADGDVSEKIRNSVIGLTAIAAVGPAARLTVNKIVPIRERRASARLLLATAIAAPCEYIKADRDDPTVALAWISDEIDRRLAERGGTPDGYEAALLLLAALPADRMVAGPLGHRASDAYQAADLFARTCSDPDRLEALRVLCPLGYSGAVFDNVDDPTIAWDVVAALAETWSGTVSELFETSRHLRHSAPLAVT